MRRIVLSATLLAALYAHSAAACEGATNPTKIVVIRTGEPVAGEKPTGLSKQFVCINLEGREGLSRVPISEQPDANSFWHIPLPIVLTGDEKISRLYFPDQPDIKVQTTLNKASYQQGGTQTCAMMGEIHLQKTALISIGFQGLDATLLNTVWLHPKGVEYFPVSHPASGCIDLSRSGQPDKASHNYIVRVDDSVTDAAQVLIRYIDKNQQAKDLPLKLSAIVQNAKTTEEARKRAQPTSLAAAALAANPTSGFVSLEGGKVVFSYVTP